MKAYIGLTDIDWFTFLASQPRLEEINFWRPGGTLAFSAIQPNELFLFKLHKPQDVIVGGGLFAHFSFLPISLAWDAFGIANGAATYGDMRAQIDQYRRRKREESRDYTIGCILLSQPFFLPESQWIPQPKDWRPNIVQGKAYNLETEPGLTLWRQLQERMPLAVADRPRPAVAERVASKYGEPVQILPRLGQGAFRIVVMDAYERRCAVTGEKVLPVLEAGHIKPYAQEGTHQPNNGMLLRSDLHKLFDLGYVTVTPDYQFEVSRRVREEFENGHEYYDLHGQEIYIPRNLGLRPSVENLSWHNEHVYRR
jgi:putative restriction endonuclease